MTGERRRLYRHWVRDPLAGARMLAGHHAVRLIPTGLASSIGGRIARALVPRLHPGADRRARAALRVLRPDLAANPDALDAAMRRYWDAIGRVYTEFSAEERMWDEGRITVEGAGHLAAARAGGRAAIVAGLHLANWEVLPISLGYLGHRFVQVYQPLPNRFESRIALATRMRANARIEAAGPGGCRLLPPSPGTPAALLRALKAGESFMMFVDEYVDGRVQAPAFGRPGPTDGNLARVVRLARLSGAAVIPAYATRERGARFVVRYLPPLTMRVTGDKDADMAANITALNEAVEPMVREHASGGYMLMNYRGRTASEPSPLRRAEPPGHQGRLH